MKQEQHETRTNMKQEQTWNKNKCGEKKYKKRTNMEQEQIWN